MMATAVVPSCKWVLLQWTISIDKLSTSHEFYVLDID